jgi:hypothetical protein
MTWMHKPAWLKSQSDPAPARVIRFDVNGGITALETVTPVRNEKGRWVRPRKRPVTKHR